MDELKPKARPVAGYIFHVTPTSIKLAGGRDALLDRFAARARTFFGDEAQEVRVNEERLWIERSDERWIRLRCIGTSTRDGSVILDLCASGDEWDETCQAFADLVAQWPEIISHRVVPAFQARQPIEATVAAARAIVIADQRATTAYLQRKLMIGYNTAASIMEQLEQAGVISPPDHDGKRRVLVNR